MRRKATGYELRSSFTNQPIPGEPKLSTIDEAIRVVAKMTKGRVAPDICRNVYVVDLDTDSVRVNAWDGTAYWTKPNPQKSWQSDIAWVPDESNIAARST